MNWNNPNLWIILAVVGLSFLQWVVQRIREQAAINKAREAVRRKNEEALRTGRAPESEQQARQQLQETRTALDDKQRQAVERRQEQLRELRRKQMETQARARTRASAGSPRPGGATMPIPTPTRSPAPARVPTPPSRTPQPRPTPTPVQARTGQTPPAPQTPKRSTLTRPAGQASEMERITRERQEDAARRRKMMQGTPSLPSTAPLSDEEIVRPALATFKGLGGQGVTTPDAHDATTTGSELLANLQPDDWRRGIILSEILREPVSIRGATHGQRF